MSGSNIVHTHAVRMRCVGSGNLQMQLQGYNDIITLDLVALPMAATSARDLNRLCNFMSQYAKLEGFTTEINEVFRINHIILFVKPVYTDYPA